MSKPDQQSLFDLKPFEGPNPQKSVHQHEEPSEEQDVNHDYRAIPLIEGMPVEPRNA